MLKQDPNPTASGKRYDADTHQWLDEAPATPTTTPAAAAADQPAAEE